MRPQASNKQPLLPWQQECCHLQKGDFCASPPEFLTACKIWRGVENFLFTKMLDSYKDLFLISRKKHVFVPSYRGKVGRGEGKGSQNLFWPFKEYQFCLLICHNSDPPDQWNCGFLWSESTGSKQIHKCGKDKKEKRAKPTNHWLYFQGILVWLCECDCVVWSSPVGEGVVY